jgi:hypothetical protein
MRFFVRRRVLGAAITLATLTAAWTWADHMDRRLESSSFFTGWLLLGALVSLALFQVRKKLPMPPLGSAATWLQVHVYTGLGTVGLFALHTPLRWPGGGLESVLAALYAMTFTSGVIGLYWTRSLPKRLSRLGQEVIYERIAALRGRLRDRAQAAVLTVVRTGGATTLGEFYNARLHEYFSAHRGWRYRFLPTSNLRKALMAELTEASRYLSDDERKTAEALFALVRERDDLDYAEALQWRLKAWLFVHIALTYPLLAAAGLHAWTAHVFYGGAP